MQEEKLIPFKYMLAFYILDVIWSIACLVGWGYAVFVLGASVWWTVLLFVLLASLSKKRFVSFVRMRIEEL